MIALISSENVAAFLSATSFDPVIGARIYTLFQVYGCDMMNCCLWLQTDVRGTATAAVSRFDGRITVSAAKYADMDELREFIRVIGGFEGVDASPKLCAGLKATGEYDSSVTMVYDGAGFEPESCGVNCSPKLEDVFKAISEVDQRFRDTSDWAAWYTYTSHLIRHGLGFCHGIYEDGKLVSTGGVYTMGEEHAVIGGLATLPEYRGRGYAGRILRSLINEILKRGKTPSLFCAEDSLAEYYAGMGFKKFGSWGQIKL